RLLPLYGGGAEGRAGGDRHEPFQRRRQPLFARLSQAGSAAGRYRRALLGARAPRPRRGRSGGERAHPAVAAQVRRQSQTVGNLWLLVRATRVLERLPGSSPAAAGVSTLAETRGQS